MRARCRNCTTDSDLNDVIVMFSSNYFSLEVLFGYFHIPSLYTAISVQVSFNHLYLPRLIPLSIISPNQPVFLFFNHPALHHNVGPCYTRLWVQNKDRQTTILEYHQKSSILYEQCIHQLGAAANNSYSRVTD